MKKIISRFLVLMLCAMFGLGVYATESDPVVIEGNTTEITVTDESSFTELLEGFTTSTFWTTTGMVLTAVIGCIATFRKNFGSLETLVKNKADAKAISEALKASSTELSATFNNKLTEIETRLNTTDGNEKILITILTIFMTNANINPNAKAEIMQYLSGIKDMNASVAEMVEAANKIIQEANEAELKEPTPALDSIVNEETESKMVLG